MATTGPDPYGDFSFEEGGDAVAAPSATASSPAPHEGVTEYEIEASSANEGYSGGADSTDIEGFAPLSVNFSREGK